MKNETSIPSGMAAAEEPVTASSQAATTAPSAGVDIFDLDPVANSEKGADIELRHPASGRYLGMFLNLIGSESAEVRAYSKRKVAEQTRKQFSNRGNRKADADQIAKETVDKIFDRTASVELALVATKGWWRYANPDAEVKEGQTDVEAKGRIETWLFQGEELAFTPENAKRVFEARPWIATQADAGTQELNNFFTD